MNLYIYICQLCNHACDQLHQHFTRLLASDVLCYFVMFPLSIKIGKTVPIAFAAGSSFQGRVLRVPAARTLSEFIIQQVSVEGTPPRAYNPLGGRSHVGSTSQGEPSCAPTQRML